MTVGKGGEEYEKKVMAVLNRNIKKLPKLKIKKLPAGFASNLPDLILLYGDTEIRVEIKMNIDAQMGGGSYNYDKKTGKFYASKNTVIDSGVHKMIMKTLKSKKTALDKLLLYAKKNAPEVLSESINGLPLTAPRELWDELREKAFLRPLNGKIEVGIDFLHDHYAKKKCYYMQIGGYGLFYLKENPLNLPIPQLNTAMNLEIRLGAAGSKMNQYQFHTSLGKAKFMKSSLLTNSKKYLHDLERKSPSGTPMLVTFDSERKAKDAVKKFGGQIEKTPMGTFRIYLKKSNKNDTTEQDMTESTLNQTFKIKVASGNMRVQGRLKKQGAIKSPYSLENGDQFVKLFGSLTNADLERLKKKMK